MSANMCRQILKSLLKFVARTKAHEAFPDYWKQLEPLFDNLSAQNGKRAQSDGVPRINFFRAHRLWLSLFVDMKLCTDIEMMVQSQQDPGSELLDTMNQSTIGLELFTPEMMKEELRQFVQDVGKKIQRLGGTQF